ncbi:MAG: hypothetical protein Q8L74_03540 [Nitrospirota bacterium]|nr:hypothetical protein [Nitrospirota bacterium]MDP2382368.1 hypothetical protein [Nitrospirota bacterium]MDP3599342.1 hypothetical protein [Nitrospirota bacterium]
MSQKPNQLVDLAQADARLKQWRSRHNTPEKVAAAHRKVLLERVSQSMAFENQLVSIGRLKALTSTSKPEAS